jgi:hypothetical protein
VVIIPIINGGYIYMGYMMGYIYIYTGWWFQPTTLKNDGVQVSWDDDIPN